MVKDLSNKCGFSPEAVFAGFSLAECILQAAAIIEMRDKIQELQELRGLLQTENFEISETAG